MGHRRVKLLRPRLEDSTLQEPRVKPRQGLPVSGQTVAEVLDRAVSEVDVEDRVLADALHCETFRFAGVNQGRTDAPANLSQAAIGAFGAQFRQSSETGGAGYREAIQRTDLVDIIVRRNGGAVIYRHHLRAAHEGRQGVAAAHDLAHGAHIGGYAVVFLGPAVGQAESGHDFVEDQQHAGVPGDLAQTLQKARVGGYGTLQGFRYHRSDLVLMRGQDGGRGVQIIELGHEHQVVQSFWDTGGVGFRLRKFHRRRGEDGHHGIVAGAVVAALELEDLFLPGVRPGHAHGLEACVGATGGEANLFSARNRVDQLLGQQDGLIVGGEKGGAPADGGQDGLGHRGMSMPQDHRAGTHQPVHVLVAGHVPDAPALALSDQELQPVRIGGVPGTAAGEILGGFLQEIAFEWCSLGHTGLPSLM